VLGLPTGSSPIPTYKHLIRLVKDGKLSCAQIPRMHTCEALTNETLHRFKNVVTFNMDEYVGLPEDHPESYHTFMFREFFSHGTGARTVTATSASFVRRMVKN
jgi:6-phosphogluconolactonase/glucosamine-6-phosphate isomerase/deaminase